MPKTNMKVPSHLSKINPARRAKGEANPAIKIQITVEIKNIKVSDLIALFLKEKMGYFIRKSVFG